MIEPFLTLSRSDSHVPRPSAGISLRPFVGISAASEGEAAKAIAMAEMNREIAIIVKYLLRWQMISNNPNWTCLKC